MIVQKSRLSVLFDQVDIFISQIMCSNASKCYLTGSVVNLPKLPCLEIIVSNIRLISFSVLDTLA